MHGQLRVAHLPAPVPLTARHARHLQAGDLSQVQVLADLPDAPQVRHQPLNERGRLAASDLIARFSALISAPFYVAGLDA